MCTKFSFSGVGDFHIFHTLPIIIRVSFDMTLIFAEGKAMSCCHSHSNCSHSAPDSRKTIAVFYGGPSPEHDVSIVTALQIISAIDTQRYKALPVYISPDGRWFIGDALKERSNYVFDREAIKALTPVTLDISRSDGMRKRGRLLYSKKKLFSSNVAAEFDLAFPAFHGSFGEDGNFQGLMEFAGIPYAGMRTMACSLLMDKAATKYLLKALDIPALPFAPIFRPQSSNMAEAKDIKAAMKEAGIQFPCILKPSHLGSSIGIAKVTSVNEVLENLPLIFGMDGCAILEPFVENLVEYNAAVTRINGKIQISAIERPKATDELLDFKQKYLSGGNDKGGNKTGQKNPGQISQGMLSLTRELNPKLTKKLQGQIEQWATTLFEALDGTGAPRIDFIGNSKTGELWLNEVNPWPGSCGYFLWEAHKENPLLFTELLTHLAEEALAERRKQRMPKDPVPRDARLFKRALSEVS